MTLIEVTSLDFGVRHLRMDDAAHHNALTVELVEQLLGALGNIRQDPAAKAVIVTGRADVFCSGAPLDMLTRAVKQGMLDDQSYDWVIDLVGFPLPVIGVLEGPAVGGGLMLALLLCDMCIAAENSRYGFNFTDMGFTPGMGATTIVPALVGYAMATEMLTGGKLYRGHELRNHGLFNAVVPASETWSRGLDLALRIADRPREMLVMLKEALSVPRRTALPEALARERAMHRRCFADPHVGAMIATAYIGMDGGGRPEDTGRHSE